MNVLRVGAANDTDASSAPRDLRKDKRSDDFDTASHIGYGSPRTGRTMPKPREPLGRRGDPLTNELGWPEDARNSSLPDGVYDSLSGVGKRGANARLDWTT